jgi:hypothetical protein
MNNNNTKIDTNLMVRPLLTIIGVLFIFYFFLYLIKYYYESINYLISFILIIFLMVVLLFIIYNLVKDVLYNLIKSNNKEPEPSKFSLYLKNLISKVTTYIINEYNSTSRGSIITLIGTITIITLYFIIPFMIQKINVQGGNQLIKYPIYTNVVNNISSYEKLNGGNSFKYQYGISFWVFIHSFPPSTNSQYNKFTSLINYGNKPNILYNPSLNTLMVTIEQKGLKDLNNIVLDFDDNGNRIIYKHPDILLQKWNNIVINYSNGTLDVFFNGKLVKSSIEVVPYMTLDNLVVGSENGISGGICNLVYFKKPLNAINISYLYNIVKDKTPPII